MFTVNGQLRAVKCYHLTAEPSGGKAIKLNWVLPTTVKINQWPNEHNRSFLLHSQKSNPPLNMCPRLNVTPRELAANVPLTLVISWPAAVSLLLLYLPSSFLTCTVTVEWIHDGISQTALQRPNQVDLYPFTATQQTWRLSRWSQPAAGYQTHTINSSLPSLY